MVRKRQKDRSNSNGGKIMKKMIKWLKDNLDRDLYEYYGIKKGERI
jgi:hypothetical protein